MSNVCEHATTGVKAYFLYNGQWTPVDKSSLVRLQLFFDGTLRFRSQDVSVVYYVPFEFGHTMCSSSLIGRAGRTCIRDTLRQLSLNKRIFDLFRQAPISSRVKAEMNYNPSVINLDRLLVADEVCFPPYIPNYPLQLHLTIDIPTECLV